MSTSDQDPAAQRLGTRLRRRLVIAVLAGPLTGLVIGLGVGLVFFEAGGRGFTMSILAAAVACTMLALLWATYSSLESPDPGREPSDTARPIADRQDLVREERNEALDGQATDHDDSRASPHA